MPAEPKVTTFILAVFPWFFLLLLVAIFDLSSLSFPHQQKNWQRLTNVPRHLLENLSKVRRLARKLNLPLAKLELKLMMPKQRPLVSKNCSKGPKMLNLPYTSKTLHRLHVSKGSSSV